MDDESRFAISTVSDNVGKWIDDVSVHKCSDVDCGLRCGCSAGRWMAVDEGLEAYSGQQEEDDIMTR